MQLSGIGGKNLLNSLGIKINYENDAVGTNLRDHLQTRLTYKVNSKKNYNYPTITIAMSSSKIFFSNFVCLNFATLLPHLLCLISAIIEQHVNRITRITVLKMFLKCSYLAKTQNGHIVIKKLFFDTCLT